MEHSRVVARRRMVRRYLPEPVDRAVLERIASAALRGPSAGGTRGISVIIVTDRVTRAAIARTACEEQWAAKGRAPWLSPAPAHLVLCVDPGAYQRRYSQPDKTPAALALPWWWVDAGAALALVLLAAVDEGLAAGFLGAHALPGLAGLLGIPEGITPLGVVTVGHPAPEPAGRPRRVVEPAALHGDRWGTPFLA